MINDNHVMSKEGLKERIIENLKTIFRKKLNQASKEEIHQALAFTIRDIVSDKWIATHDQYQEKDVKVVYYLSMEFLMGRWLGNTVLNLGIYDEVREVLDELGLDPDIMDGTGRDPGLGNGGLGRLAACFLDSLSTLEYPAYGCGIRYHYGIFEQRIENGYQVEYPDNWLEDGDIWGVKRPEYAAEVKFGGNVVGQRQENGSIKFIHENAQSVIAVPYDYPIPGYRNNTVNTLRLWDAEEKNKFDLASFNQGNYAKSVEEQNLAKTLSEVLYPADEMISGKELRLKQQYFFISATIQRVLQRFSSMNKNFDYLPDKVQLQLNDTHPTVAIAELMRLLLDEYGLSWNDAWDITRRTCSYTNHTIMSEALEKWPIELFSRVLPRIYTVVEEINRRFCALLVTRYGDNPEKIRQMAIVADGQVRMAHLAIVGGHSVNGVAAIHTEILKKQELNDFYKVFPEKFNNKTNGITQRRWLALCNPELADLITDVIGYKWLTNLDELARIEPLADDAAFRKKFMAIKLRNKIRFAQYAERTTGVIIDPNSMFDVQIKRLHEYKRQLLNILHIIHLYHQMLINPNLGIAPRTFIFSAKAAASYHRAKLIIKFINNVANVINNDKNIEGRLKVLFMENYRVSLAEALIPAADLSEQISTAGKEASGTGNMKFMLNGAVTIGTMDGANVEIFEEVGKENIFIFGHTADEIIRMSSENSYAPWDVYNMNQNVRGVMTSLINGEFSENHELFRELYEALLNGYGGSRADEYFILKDFQSYTDTQELAGNAFTDESQWARSAILNTAKSGKFSSDRTIKQYANEIWDLKPVPIVMS